MIVSNVNFQNDVLIEALVQSGIKATDTVCQI